ncbi:barstar family protein [Leclercia sp.]|uniref:barstar family protein n=1 Tax=Leclercia sp. TaxID=1898428 RepID=UPI00289E48F9|nr:barstar family protein [Leclercia sp.]
MCTIILDGTKIQTEQDFHKLLSGLLNFGSYYGNNLDALWDRLSTDVERPIQIIWLNSVLSRKSLGEVFDKIINIFEKIKQHNLRFNWGESFDYVLK